VAGLSSDDPNLGRVLKQTYLLEQKIGAGGMGTVYRARQTTLDRTVAVKLLSPDPSDRESFRRFFREAKMLGRLSHPNVVQIIDFGNTEDGLVFMVLEYLEGDPLDRLVQAGDGLPLSVACPVMTQACAAVGAAHQVPLVHRDIKPSNLFVARLSDGSRIVKVLDFGLAKLADDGTLITSAGVALGTPAYMAPEQIEESAPVDGRADIYALGGIFYFMVTGEQPYAGCSTREILGEKLRRPPNLFGLDDRGLAETLLDPLRQAMSLDPAQRQQTATELADALRQAAGLQEAALPASW